ncbi:MAG: response regulator [Phycisphaerales bacterium]|nr:response regulator [Phycisphaerales bacterium]
MNIPVVIVSAYSDADYLDIATRVGVFGYMLKPVTRETLRVNLAVAWGRFNSTLNSVSASGNWKPPSKNAKSLKRPRA